MFLPPPSVRWFVLAAGTMLGAAPSSSGATHLRTPTFSLVFAQASLDPLPTPDSGRLQPVEMTFLTETIANTRSQTELSRLALAQATSSALREFAQQLISDSTEADVALEALARRKAVEVPVQPTSYSEDYRQLASRPGAEFDRAFIQRISASTDRVLRLCELAVQHAKDPDIRSLAGNLLPVIRSEVNRTTDLRKSL